MLRGTHTKGPTLREGLAVLALLVILAVMMCLQVPPESGLFKGTLTQMAGHAHELFLAGSQMADDYDTVGDEKFGWPGDLTAREGKAKVVSVKDYVQRLLELEYLKPRDARKIFSAPGLAPWDGKPETFSGEKNCAFKIYRVTKDDREANLFLVSRNFTYGKVVDPSLPPTMVSHEHRHGFFAICMGGEVKMYKEEQATQVEKIGLLPGRRNWKAGDIETAADTLRQE